MFRKEINLNNMISKREEPYGDYIRKIKDEINELRINTKNLKESVESLNDKMNNIEIILNGGDKTNV